VKLVWETESKLQRRILSDIGKSLVTI